MYHQGKENATETASYVSKRPLFVNGGVRDIHQEQTMFGLWRHCLLVLRFESLAIAHGEESEKATFDAAVNNPNA